MLRRFKMTRFPHDIDGRAVPLRELLLVYTALVMQAQNFTLKQCTALRGWRQRMNGHDITEHHSSSNNVRFQIKEQSNPSHAGESITDAKFQ